MRLVQISDLHIGGLFKQDAFDKLVDEVNNDLKPDVIIISGDLTDDGLIFQFEQEKMKYRNSSATILLYFQAIMTIAILATFSLKNSFQLPIGTV